MATNERSASASAADPEAIEFGVGMAHTTVVPTNFDPDEADRRRD